MQEPQESQVQSLGWEDPLERAWQPTPVFFPGESHGQRSLAGYSPWGQKESTESLHDWSDLARLHSCISKVPTHWLEKEMAAHSSVLAWKIPRTAEPGGLPSTGSHRVGHDWRDSAAAAAAAATAAAAAAVATHWHLALLGKVEKFSE